MILQQPAMKSKFPWVSSTCKNWLIYPVWNKNYLWPSINLHFISFKSFLDSCKLTTWWTSWFVTFGVESLTITFFLKFLTLASAGAETYSFLVYLLLKIFFPPKFFFVYCPTICRPCSHGMRKNSACSKTLLFYHFLLIFFSDCEGERLVSSFTTNYI